ncbi:PLP-dependent aminotransferase family protein [Thalassospira sp. TSL5-1]|uniref:aminotransferase-like domain-containing protein n=1 Tax=Thalassospira sp. TSL5-1 TaxID=1544451 RepID=UPI00093EF477|nr:PLP-dependent aminotransferase family protein [Thalassospira sp. TSL5-1]OKH89695.1 GntR family transcriptional regulator [Thalassospira sp. TSL5-1]
MTIWIPDISSGSGPVYRRIAHAIGDAVEKGQLQAGDRLPTHRDLAYHLGVTVGTVTRAYREAERLGLAIGEVGRGTYVSVPMDINTPLLLPGHPVTFDADTKQPETNDIASTPRQEITNGYAASAGNTTPVNFGTADVSFTNQREPRHYYPEQIEDGPINFRMNCPLPPRESHINQVLIDIAQSGPIESLITYKTEYGMPHHRQALATMAGRFGLDDNPDRVLPTAGVQHAMTVALMTFIRPGDLVLCEELTYPNLRSLAAMMQFRLRGIAMDEEGILPDVLDNLCRTQSPRVIYLMPTLHNPLCSTMSHERRIAIAEILRKHNLILIEDGIYGFLDTAAPPPLSCFVPERAVYLNGISKSVGGGLRIGFIHAPIQYIAKLASGIRTTCMMTPGIGLELATRLINDGTVERYENWHREEASRRLGIILGSLKGYDVRFHPTNYHIWLALPDHIETSELVMNAANSGVMLTAAQQFAVGVPPRGLRLAFGAERSTERIHHGVNTILRLLQTSEFSDAHVM